MKYSVITFGCRVNQADSFGFEEELRAGGATAVAPEDADLVVVNTCSVTATADQGARQTIRRLARDNPRARIVVTGCYASRRPDELAVLPGVGRVICNDEKPQLVRMVRATDAGSGDARDRLGDARDQLGDARDRTTAERFGGGEGGCGAAIEPGVAGRTAFTLRVQTGCAQPCSYCIIPTTRGVPRSVTADLVLTEFDRVTAAGFKEIAITGVHLGSYGRDLPQRSSLAELLGALASRAATRRTMLRVSSLEPMDCTPAVVELVATCRSLARHFHLPVQHASNRMLAAMRRPYTIEAYAALVSGIRQRIPDASIGSDLIVGFPGETDDDFEALKQYLERSPLTHIHVFPYSDRPGTDAALMRPKVHGSVIRRRAQEVRDIGRHLSDAFKASQIGAVHIGLTLEDGSLVVTDNYLKVRIPPGVPRNEWVNVRITSVDAGGIAGEVEELSPRTPASPASAPATFAAPPR